MPTGLPILDRQWIEFLALLALGHPVGRACRMAGISPSPAYRRRSEDAAFGAQWEEARAEGIRVRIDELEDEADRRANDGWDEPVFHEGKQCGTKRRYSDTLLIFRLKALRPERYRENQDITLSSSSGGPVEIVYRWADDRPKGPDDRG